MPQVEFSSQESAVGELLALMLYPDDERKRRESFVTSEVRRLTFAPDASSLTLSADDARALLAAPSWDEIKRVEEARAKMGFVAGQVLATLYLTHRFRGTSKYFVPSMNRAIFVAQSLAAKGALFGDGTPMPRSDRTIRTYWRNFAPVAHYWATLRLGGLGYPFSPKREALAPAHFPRFLGIANAMFRFGVQFVPEGAQPALPLLDPATAHALPPGVGFVELQSDRFPDLLRDLLKAYRAPK
jgi:hypothetical protein